MSTGEKISNPLGEWIKTSRSTRGWSLRVLADKMDNVCDASYISQIENETYKSKKGKPIRPDDAILEALARAFSTPKNFVRSLVGLGPLAQTDPETQPDQELEFLFHASRDWSEENRIEAIENAKVIFRRYQEKEETKRKGKNKPEEVEVNPFLAEIERDFVELNKPKPPAPVEIEKATEEDMKDLPGYRLVDGKLKPTGKIKKPSE